MIEDLHFLHPEYFLMFAIPIAWLIYTMITKKRVDQLIFSEDILKKLRSDSGGLSLRVRSFIALFSLLFIITALSRPVSSDGVLEVESKSVDIVFAIDISKSMLATDSYPNRLEFAKRKALDLIEKMPKSRIGVIAFANNSYIVSPLTFDHKAVSYLLNSLDTESISEQGTSIETLLESAKEFLKSENEKNLLIFTDGGDSESYSSELELANSYGFKIYTVGFGTEEGSPIPKKDGTFIEYNGNIVITQFNNNIKDLAKGSGGFYLHSTNSNEDIDYLSNEFKKLQSLEKKKQEIPIYIEYFYYPLMVALLLIVPLFYSLPKFRKKQKSVASILMLLLLSPLSQELEAGIFDFYHLDRADKLYSSGNYREAIEEYRKIDLSDEVNYNIANSYYRDGNFSEAIKHYRKVSAEDRELKQKALYNIGNSFASQELYEDAKKSYEESLKFGEDNSTNENLNWVKEILEKQKKEQENQQGQDGDNQQENQESQNSDQQDNKNQDSNSKDGDKEGESKESESENDESEDNQDAQQNSQDGEESENSEDLDDKSAKQKDQNSDSQGKEQEGENRSEQNENNNSKESFIKEKLDDENSSKNMSRTLGGEESADENLTDNLQDEKILRILQNQNIGTKIFGILPHKENSNDNKPW